MICTECNSITTEESFSNFFYSFFLFFFLLGQFTTYDTADIELYNLFLLELGADQLRKQ